MITVAHMTEERSVISKATPTPFEQVLVTLTKAKYTKLIWAARYWETAHQRALVRAAERETQHHQALDRAALREAALRTELDAALAKVRELQKRVFGRKSEQSSSGTSAQTPKDKALHSRGQQLGARGHGRTKQDHLPARIEDIGLDVPQCPCCGLGFADFPGTEDSEVLEIDVKAYRRVIRRKRYRKTCTCPTVPGIITAPAPARLIPRGKYGISVWVHLLLSKFMYGQPTHRLLGELADFGLTLSAGTLTGGLKVLAPLFVPLEEAFLTRLRSEAHWHADETRWQVFVETEGKIGHRWYLWVFQSKSVIHYVLDATRSADVPIAELSPAQGGIVSCDRYSAYKKFVRIHTDFTLSFCWAHQRRDFLELANAYPDLSAWALDWAETISELYRLNDQRLDTPLDSNAYAACDQAVQQAVRHMAVRRDAELDDPALSEPALKVLRSMQAHWSGLTVFVDHPEVPMDNNTAERAIRAPVVGRKNYYGSGSKWSGKLAATMFSLLRTIQLWKINPRTWLSAYLHACAANGNQAPADLIAFLPWAMDAEQLAAMRGVAHDPVRPAGHDSS